MCRNSIVLFLFISLFWSCHEGPVNPNKYLSLDSFSDMSAKEYRLDAEGIRKTIRAIAKTDGENRMSDRHVKQYYQNHNPFLWITRSGIDHRADSLLSFLNTVEKSGLSPVHFRRSQIERDMRRIRQLSVGQDEVSDINAVFARLEYNLTKAYLKYVSGQYFGFVNPNQLYNKLCVKDSDSLHVTYFHLYDVAMKHPSQEFISKCINKIRHDSVDVFLRDVQPVSKLYQRLCTRLTEPSLTSSQRMAVLCNIERCRWRLDDYPENHKKHIVVNIPSYTLYAVDKDSVMTMKVGCGTNNTKTPLLTSRIHRMDINPVWIVPQSIAKGIVYKHGYLRKEHMYILDKKEGKLDVEYASYDKIMSGQQHIVQEGGAGNSLGRIIFRFPNNHAVYLHDTSSPWLFSREHRAVSHGCVRVQKPFELAVFLLGKKDEDVIEKIRYSMTADVNNYDENDGVDKSQIDRDKLIHHLDVSPEVPLFITYYTLYPDVAGNLVEYKDVYGYDKALYNELKEYVGDIQ